MMGTRQFVRYWLATAWSDAKGSQLAELAVSLPLLVLFVVGIMDFGQAFRLKYQLDITAQQAARVAAGQTMADITSTGTPKSTRAVRDAIDSYLLSMKINDCGLASASGAKSSLRWTYTTTGSCPGPLTVIIDRGNTYSAGGGTPATIEGTHITIRYPYQWRFNRVVQLLFPSTTFTGPTQIRVEAVVQNLS